MLEYNVVAKRTDAHGSLARCKDAEVRLDTDVKGRPDAFNPAELFLAAIAACMIKDIERVAPMLHFEFRGVEVHLHGVARQNGGHAILLCPVSASHLDLKCMLKNLTEIDLLRFGFLQIVENGGFPCIRLEPVVLLRVNMLFLEFCVWMPFLPIEVAPHSLGEKLIAFMV